MSKAARENPLVDLRNDHVIRLLAELRHADSTPTPLTATVAASTQSWRVVVAF